MKIVLVSVAVAAAILLLARLVGRMPANCDDVAEQLASFELGNYAELEDRAPVVDRFRAVCMREGVSRDEGACLDKARSRFAGARCAPRLFPDIELCEGAACLVTRLKQFAAQMCACGPGDRPCADKVNGQIATWGRQQASARDGEPEPPPSEQDALAMREVMTHFSECMTKAVTPQ